MAERIRKYKKPSSLVPGDIPKKLVNNLSNELAIPLTLIYKNCLLKTAWPRLWKNEIVIPIPKTQTPVSYNDIRPISMSPLWSKVLESIVAELTLEETKRYWNPNQHGGEKGSSTDHVIIEAWDVILRSLDKSSSNKAVVFAAIDFSKSFSRCSHMQILDSYRQVKASQWLIDMHAAFLMGRTMSVKVGTHISVPKQVTGGAVQGSVFGVLDHNVVLNNLDDEVDPTTHVAKYVDDMTLIETVPAEVETEVNVEGNRPLHIIKPKTIKQSFMKIKIKSESKGLKINEGKTQLLSVSSAYYDTQAQIEIDDDKIVSQSELKMLGFKFSKDPNVSHQLDYLFKKANKRFFILLRHKKAGLPNNRLRDVYSSIIRSCLEYSSPVYHSQLNQGHINLLERMQKRCLRAIYGYEYDYQTLLQMSGLRSLEDRRRTRFEKFTKNTLKNPKYSHWFPPNNNTRSGRHTHKYLEERSNGNRLYNSPIFAMRRFLNQTEDRLATDLTGLFNSP